mmetsp:Transcript_34415/g.108425  ORF Transcript_34415/g.108425 Transcript_34415/m.108425 type:complete len:256 (-) Transcript_34415:445-1212(-)
MSSFRPRLSSDVRPRPLGFRNLSFCAVSHSTAVVKRAPKAPLRTPTRAKSSKSEAGRPSKAASLSEKSAMLSSTPKMAYTIAPLVAQKAARARFFVKYAFVTTSMLKSTPPKGVPKVAATPAAQAHMRISSRLESRSATLLKGLNLRHMSATTQAMWMKGPSFPTLSPASSDSTRPQALATSIRGCSSTGFSAPESTTRISGTPEPAASGQMACVAAQASAARTDEAAAYPKRGCHVPFRFCSQRLRTWKSTLIM